MKKCNPFSRFWSFKFLRKVELVLRIVVIVIKIGLLLSYEQKVKMASR